MGLHAIESGKHYDNKLFSSWPHLGQREFRARVQFCANCAYEVGSYYQQDCNKLYGAAFGLRGAHWNSARFGWWYDPRTQDMVLTAYCYDRGRKNVDAQLLHPEVARVKLGQTVDLSIRVLADSYVFTCKQGDATLGQLVNVPHAGVSLFGWTLGFYFGGELRCPHYLTAYID